MTELREAERKEESEEERKMFLLAGLGNRFNCVCGASDTRPNSPAAATNSRLLPIMHDLQIAVSCFIFLFYFLAVPFHVGFFSTVPPFLVKVLWDLLSFGGGTLALSLFAFLCSLCLRLAGRNEWATFFSRMSLMSAVFCAAHNETLMGSVDRYLTLRMCEARYGSLSSYDRCLRANESGWICVWNYGAEGTYTPQCLDQWHWSYAWIETPRHRFSGEECVPNNEHWPCLRVEARLP
jgi:hypothetical protein